MSNPRLQQAYRGGYRGQSGWWLHFSFDEEAIGYLKAYPNNTHRFWDEEHKRWWIAESIAEQVAVFIPGLEAHLRQGALL